MVGMAQWQLTNELVAAPPGAAAALRKVERSLWIAAAWHVAFGAILFGGGVGFWHPLWAFAVGLSAMLPRTSAP